MPDQRDDLAPHGTAAAARRHYRHGENPCEPCRAASNAGKVQRTGDPSRLIQPEARGAVRNGLSEQPYVYRAPRPSRAIENIRRAGAIYDEPPQAELDFEGRQEAEGETHMPAHATDPDPGKAAAWAGFTDARRIVTAQYAAGVGLDQIQQHHQDIAARLLADAQTSPGRAYAREYATTAETLVADLRQDAAAATREPEPGGTPHHDPHLAARGWQRCAHGIYVRRLQPQADREACRPAHAT